MKKSSVSFSNAAGSWWKDPATFEKPIEGGFTMVFLVFRLRVAKISGVEEGGDDCVDNYDDNVDNDYDDDDDDFDGNVDDNDIKLGRT